ncbi:hypothetical protein [Natronomonas sp. EA1]|uniref:hypothetical protein n=1 Tax=Natronomonas sp. EA1 TaxID=3421655 RepID=UPI003EBDCD98
MTVWNLRGQRESAHRKGQNYKEQVISYLKAQGWVLVEDSEFHGRTPDLVLSRPKVEGTRRAVVEVKASDKLSLSDSSLLAELGRYFLEYESQGGRFDFMIFAPGLANLSRWRSVFEPSQHDEEEIKRTWGDVRDCSELNEDEQSRISGYTIDDFTQFLVDCRVAQGDYVDLEHWIDDMADDGRFESEFYFEEPGPIEGQTSLVPNFYRITQLPQNVYTGDLEKDATHQNIREVNPNYFPIWVEEDSLHSLIAPQDLPEEVTHFVKSGSWNPSRFDEWQKQSGNQRSSIGLMNKFVTHRAVNFGCTSTRHNGKYILYFEHDDLNQETIEKEGMQVSKVFSDERGETNFVRHRAVHQSLERYDGEIWIFLIPEFVYSEDGERLITSNQVKSLHDAFTDPNARNSKIRRYTRHWSDILNLGAPRPHGEDQQIATEAVTHLSLPVRPVQDSDEQGRIMDEEQAGLGDFI